MCCTSVGGRAGSHAFASSCFKLFVKHRHSSCQKGVSNPHILSLSGHRRPRALALAMTASTESGNETKARESTHESNAKLWATLSLDSAVLSAAQFASGDGGLIQAVWSQRDVVASRKRLFSQTYFLDRNGVFKSTPPVEMRSSLSSSPYYSPSRKRFVKFSTDLAGPDTILIEVWNTGGGLEISWEVDASTHGPVFTDEWFGSVAWSPDEKMVAYIADRGKKPGRLDASRDPQETWINPLEHKFHENSRDPLGEAYINRRSPSLFIADVTRGHSYPATKDSEDRKKDLFFGEPQWSPDGKTIVATMRKSPYLEVDDHLGSDEFWPADLGLRYCYNRRSAIVAFDAPQSVEELPSFVASVSPVSSKVDDDDFCCISPRFSPDGGSIVYVSNPAVGIGIGKDKVLPHNMTKVLRTVRMVEEGFSTPRTVIGIPLRPGRNDFPGLYVDGLLESPWLDEETIVLNTVWGSVNKVVSIRLRREGGEYVGSEGSIECVDWGAKAARAEMRGVDGGIEAGDNVLVMDCCENFLAVAVSNPGKPTELFRLRCDVSNGGVEVERASALCERSKRLGEFVEERCTVDLVTQGDGVDEVAREFEAGVDDDLLRYQATVVTPRTGGKKFGLILYPHGGPHVATLNGYSQGAMGLLRRGFAVLYVNYRGSLGLGQESLESLPGRIGSQDISEVVQATRWALVRFGERIDEKRVGFLGGSHSGFIGAHTSLIAGLFRRTVLRNPVVNVASMVGGTDIPDWCFCEGGVGRVNDAGLMLVADGEQMLEMYARSPVSRVKRGVEGIGKCLLQVGGGDRRVPPQQSLEWKRVMGQVHGSESVTLRWYPGSGHAVDEVPNGDDAWVHALDFLCEM
eukprot:GFKZ01006426.1.p1 GENE.GFKZ01006426.1~~GFKZ01006426.1.p1  ORF type:complete len:857 (+),score=93.40 GFKZ01006426.1:108-2678(+)